MKFNPSGLVGGVVVLLVVIAGGYWLLQQPHEAMAPVATSTYPTALPTSSTSTSSTLPSAPSGLPPGSIVTGRTVWEGKTGDDWKIAFNVQTTWKFSDTATADGKHLAQATGGDNTTTFFVSRNMPIAEPSKLTYTQKSETVAGKSVTAHVYANPKAGTAFYEFFSLPVGTDTYYFRLESKVASTKVAEDFISLIVIK